MPDDAMSMKAGEPVVISLRVNGREHTLPVEPRTTLLDALRERLGLTGAKKGCDQGACGACTVLVDGRRVNACLTLAVMQRGAEITTIEGPAEGDELHPVQQAFLDCDAFQCGYCTSGDVYVRGDRSRGERYARILRRNRLQSVEAAGDHNPPPPHEATIARRSFGADFAEVKVDPELGTVRVTRHVKVVEAGRILNPRIARSQIIGGVVMGIGQALTEATEVDRRDARISNAGLWGYHVPVNADVPDITAMFVERNDPHIPGGVKGIGEMAAIGTAPAIANAVCHATGRRIRDLPITPDKLL